MLVFFFHWELFAKLFSSNTAKQLASTALQPGKSAAKDIVMKAINVGKTVAIDAGKKLIEKTAKKLLTIKSQEIITKYANVTVRPEQVVKNVKDALANYVDTDAINLNKLIDRSSLRHLTASKANAIAIQEKVKSKSKTHEGLA